MLLKAFGDIGLELGITEMIPSSFDAGNPEIVEDFSLSVLIIRLTASSNLSFALDDDFDSSAATEASRTTLFVDSEADTVLDADEAIHASLGIDAMHHCRDRGQTHHACHFAHFAVHLLEYLLMPNSAFD